MPDAPSWDRIPRRDPIDRIPRPVPGEPGRFTIDATWGTIQPLELPGGVRTIAELEVMQHVDAGGLLVDTRQPEFVAEGTIPGVIAIRHQETTAGLADHRGDETVVALFCNGPQCGATPQAIAALLDVGWPAAQLRYYRGGIHDWVTLGLPLERSEG